MLEKEESAPLRCDCFTIDRYGTRTRCMYPAQVVLSAAPPQVVNSVILGRVLCEDHYRLMDRYAVYFNGATIPKVYRLGDFAQLAQDREDAYTSLRELMAAHAQTQEELLRAQREVQDRERVHTNVLAVRDAQLADMERQISAQQKELDEAYCIVEGLQSNVNTLIDVRDELKSQIDALRADLKKAIAPVVRPVYVLADAAHPGTFMAVDPARPDEVVILRKMLTQAQETIKNLTGQRSNHVAEINQLSLDRSELIERCQNLDRSLQQARTHINSLIGKRSEQEQALTEQVTAQEETIKMQGKNLMKYIQEIIAVHAALEELQGRYDLLGTVATESDRRAHEAQAALDSLQETYDQLWNNASAKNARIIELETTVQSLTSQYNNMVRTLGEKNTVMQRAEQRIVQLTEHNTQLRAAIDQLRQANEAEKIELSDTHHKHAERVADLRDQVADLRDQVAELSKMLQDREKALAQYHLRYGELGGPDY